MIFNYKKLTTLATIFLYCTSLIFFPPLAYASILFPLDNFESDISRWTTISGTWDWQNIDGSFRYGSTQTSCCSESVTGNVLWGNYTYEFTKF